MGEKTLFRPALLNLCKTKGNSLILGYGYLSLDVISDEKFIKQISEGFKDCNEPQIIIIGCKDKDFVNYIIAGSYLKSFVEKELEKNKKDKIYVEVSVYIKKKDRYRTYHKKIAIKRDKTNNHSEIHRCILGSSNLTKGPFNDGNLNQEVDIYMWNSFKINKEEEDQIVTECCSNKDKYFEVLKSYRDIDCICKKQNIGLNLTLDLELLEIIDEIDNLVNNNFKLVYRKYNRTDKFCDFEDIKDCDINKLFENIYKSNNNDIISISLAYLLKYIYIEDDTEFENIYNKIFDRVADKNTKKQLLMAIKKLEIKGEDIIRLLKKRKIDTLYYEGDSGNKYKKSKSESYFNILVYCLNKYY